MADANSNTQHLSDTDVGYRSLEYIQQAKAVNDMLYIALTSIEPTQPKKDILYLVSHAVDSLLSQAVAVLEGEVSA